MAQPLRLTLTPEQRRTLEDMRDHHAKSYLRERAACLLKIADGESARQVALHGLLKRRRPETVCSWVRRYQEEGLAGLMIKPGRGRKPAFFPRYADEKEAGPAILDVVRHAPELFDVKQSRWTLKAIAQACPWLRLCTDSGLFQMLKRLRIRYKRARSYIHSPDLFYDEKADELQACLARARTDPDRFVFLYLDEFTYFRQPTLARDYAAQGSTEPLARLSYSSNARFRVVAAMNAITGEVLYRQSHKIGLQELSEFYAAIRARYPLAKRIYIALDNWPVHFHPDVLARLQPQDFSPAPPRLPRRWPGEPSPKAIHDDLPIRLLPLPTYAPWLNPIEKLWRWLKQQILHLHRLSNDWNALKQEVPNFLDQFAQGSPALLRYVGLSTV